MRILGFFGLSKAQETKLQKPPLCSKKQPPFQKIMLGEINVHEMFGLFMGSRNTLNPISKNHPYVQKNNPRFKKSYLEKLMYMKCLGFLWALEIL